jgi:hypothetical protein
MDNIRVLGNEDSIDFSGPVYFGKGPAEAL